MSKGMPIESVSRVLGHTNIVTTQLYAKITTQKLDNDLTMFGDKLSCHIKGKVPLNTSKDYASEVSSYTKGLGIFMDADFFDLKIDSIFEEGE